MTMIEAIAGDVWYKPGHGVRIDREGKRPSFSVLNGTPFPVRIILDGSDDNSLDFTIQDVAFAAGEEQLHTTILRGLKKIADGAEDPRRMARLLLERIAVESEPLAGDAEPAHDNQSSPQPERGEAPIALRLRITIGDQGVILVRHTDGSWPRDRSHPEDTYHHAAAVRVEWDDLIEWSFEERIRQGADPIAGHIMVAVRDGEEVTDFRQHFTAIDVGQLHTRLANIAGSAARCIARDRPDLLSDEAAERQPRIFHNIEPQPDDPDDRNATAPARRARSALGDTPGSREILAYLLENGSWYASAIEFDRHEAPRGGPDFEDLEDLAHEVVKREHRVDFTHRPDVDAEGEPECVEFNTGDLGDHRERHCVTVPICVDCGEPEVAHLRAALHRVERERHEAREILRERLEAILNPGILQAACEEHVEDMTCSVVDCMGCALEETRRQRDQYHDALVARHGGEPVELLSELDEARAELAREKERREDMAGTCQAHAAHDPPDCWVCEVQTEVRALKLRLEELEGGDVARIIHTRLHQIRGEYISKLAKIQEACKRLALGGSGSPDAATKIRTGPNSPPEPSKPERSVGYWLAEWERRLGAIRVWIQNAADEALEALGEQKVRPEKADTVAMAHDLARRIERESRPETAEQD